MVLGLTKQPKLMEVLELIARRHLRHQVPDPEVRRRLTPDYRLGCKRILVSNEYLPALTRPNAQLITGGIAEIGPHTRSRIATVTSARSTRSSSSTQASAG